jgi:RND family efflux transporter MFP subunit
MKQTGLSAFLVMTIILTACGGANRAIVPAATPALTVIPSSATSPADIVVASAKVVPMQVSNLGFTISALVKEVPFKEGDVVKAGQPLVVLDTPELNFAVVAAEAAFRSAHANAVIQNADTVKSIRHRKIFFDPLPHEVQAVAESKAQQAQAALQAAQANLAQATLVAPFDGTVASVNIIPGELAQADQAVVTLATLDALQIKTTDLSEQDIHRVKIGQLVHVKIGVLNVNVTGHVISISPMSDLVGGDVVYPVTVQLDEQPQGLLWGMTAEVNIQTNP